MLGLALLLMAIGFFGCIAGFIGAVESERYRSPFIAATIAGLGVLSLSIYLIALDDAREAQRCRDAGGQHVEMSRGRDLCVAPGTIIDPDRR